MCVVAADTGLHMGVLCFAQLRPGLGPILYWKHHAKKICGLGKLKTNVTKRVVFLPAEPNDSEL
jgi:hypothetical protein